MHWISEPNSVLMSLRSFSPLKNAALAAAALAVGVSSAGCLTPSPFRDPFAGEAAVTTPSVEGIHAAGARSHLPEPQGEEKLVPTPDGIVLHRPLYFEDPAEECGSYNDTFAWTGEDFLNIVAGPLWFLGNGVTIPVDAVIYPPWRVMASDGVCGCRWPWLCHDSARWSGDVRQDEPPVVPVPADEEPVE